MEVNDDKDILISCATSPVTWVPLTLWVALWALTGMPWWLTATTGIACLGFIGWVWSKQAARLRSLMEANQAVARKQEQESQLERKLGWDGTALIKDVKGKLDSIQNLSLTLPWVKSLKVYEKALGAFLPIEERINAVLKSDNSQRSEITGILKQLKKIGNDMDIVLEQIKNFTLTEKGTESEAGLEGALDEIQRFKKAVAKAKIQTTKETE